MYLYVISDSKKKSLNIGTTNDVKKTLAFYKKLPGISMEITLNLLVYLEEYISEQECIDRHELLTTCRKQDIIDLIHGVNPDWVPYEIGKNIEL